MMNTIIFNRNWGIVVLLINALTTRHKCRGSAFTCDAFAFTITPHRVQVSESASKATVAVAVTSYKDYRYRITSTSTSVLNLSKTNHPSEEKEKRVVHIEAIASAGLGKDEIPLILSRVSTALSNQFGIDFMTNNVIHEDSAVPDSVPGAMGRVLLVSLNNVGNDWEMVDERLDPFKNVISQEIDSLVGSSISQPILVSVRTNYNVIANREKSLCQVLKDLVHDEAIMYDLCTPISANTASNVISTVVWGGHNPTIQVEIDGAMIPDPYTKREIWDTSSVMVFDDFVDHSLRERLLNVINGRGEDYNWDDKTRGPDPKRWKRGGLVDTLDEGDNEGISNCWGLREEAIHELCFEEHEAIAEVEEKISNLFSPFTVTRLPEACFGSCVSPLTANAPTFGDVFAYHIDADPNQMPPCKLTIIKHYLS